MKPKNLSFVLLNSTLIISTVITFLQGYYVPFLESALMGFILSLSITLLVRGLTDKTNPGVPLIVSVFIGCILIVFTTMFNLDANPFFTLVGAILAGITSLTYQFE